MNYICSENDLKIVWVTIKPEETRVKVAINVHDGDTTRASGSEPNVDLSGSRAAPVVSIIGNQLSSRVELPISDSGRVEVTTAAEGHGKAQAEVSHSARGTSNNDGRGGVRASSRVQTAINRLILQAPAESKVELPPCPGKGTKLRDIPNILYKMSKITGKDERMEVLHSLLFRRKGTAQSRKKDILDFRGLACAGLETEEKERASRMISMERVNLGMIHDLMDLLDIKRGSGNKEDKMTLLCDFIMKPTQLSNVDLAAKNAKKRAKPKRKRKSKQPVLSRKNAKNGGDENDASGVNLNEAEIIPEGNGSHLVSTSQIKDKIQATLDVMGLEEIKLITPRIVLKSMSEAFGCDMSSRKAEIKEIAIEKITAKLTD
jgi:hypothetical protein